jgi:HlyD family secretion protein
MPLLDRFASMTWFACLPKLSLTLLVAGALAACTDEPAPDPAATAPAASSTFAASAKGRIDIEGGVIRLAAQREGLIEKVLVEEGDSVMAGQALATLADEQVRRAAIQARAESAQALAALPGIKVRLVAAQREARRLEPLVGDQTVAGQEFDSARDQVQSLQAELQASRAATRVAAARVKVAEYEIEQRVVRAPLAGKIVRRQARPGDGVSVSTMTPLFLFAPNTPRIVRAELEERFLPWVKPGQRAEVVLEADESRKYTATVLRLGQVIGLPMANDDPTARKDAGVAECVLALDAPDVMIGQRVIVRFVRER